MIETIMNNNFIIYNHVICSFHHHEIEQMEVRPHSIDQESLTQSAIVKKDADPTASSPVAFVKVLSWN